MLVEGMLYLGPLSRFQDEQREKQVISVVLGHGVQCAQFHTEEEGFHWTTECSRLRELIADLHAQKTAGLDEQTFLYQLRSHWLPSCDYFFNVLGKRGSPLTFDMLIRMFGSTLASPLFRGLLCFFWPMMKMASCTLVLRPTLTTLDVRFLAEDVLHTGMTLDKN